ncbi:MAG: asparagine synthetase B [Bacteroidota bacterium]|nr:asparagine synthetase B [Bacteroidota bacterium]
MKYKIKRILLVIATLFIGINAFGTSILVFMDDKQTNHLKAYGVTYWVIDNGLEASWLLNYRGGSFLLPNRVEIEEKCILANVSYTLITDAETNSILSYISQEDVNMDRIKLVKSPKIAIYAPKSYRPWDDAVTLVLTYAEIPYTIVYDEEILSGELSEFDWLHIHHEDFTGQFGKFWASYKNASWYIEQVREANEKAQKLGFKKVSLLKLAVSKEIKQFVFKGGFLFAMCSATDAIDIALASEGVDICHPMFDGDPMDNDAQNKIDYSKTFAFTDFKLVTNPYEYEYSNIDVTNYRNVQEANDFFTLFDFSAKWDPVPTMLCQNHTKIIKAFMGQTTSYNKNLIKPNVLIMGELKSANETRYIHGESGKGTWTFYGGHDPADYRHLVGDPPTDLNLHPNSPGYRLILNNVLFPAAKKKKHKT